MKHVHKIYIQTSSIFYSSTDLGELIFQITFSLFYGFLMMFHTHHADSLTSVLVSSGNTALARYAERCLTSPLQIFWNLLYMWLEYFSDLRCSEAFQTSRSSWTKFLSMLSPNYFILFLFSSYHHSYLFILGCFSTFPLEFLQVWLFTGCWSWIASTHRSTLSHIFHPKFC